MTTPMTTTTSSIIPDTVEFDDTFHEFNEDLDGEANEWRYLNHFYLDFEGETLSRSHTSSQQQQHSTAAAVVSTVEKEGNHRQHDAHEYFYGIPDYLSASNSDFRVAFFCDLRSYTNPMDFQDLQQLAILAHQTTIIYLQEQLWRCCLQAGQGQLKPPQVVQSLVSKDHSNITAALSFWPPLVLAVMQSKGILQQEMYISFIQNYLNQLEKQARRRRTQFETILNRLLSTGDVRRAFNDKMENFLRREESLSAMQFHYQRRIALLEYISMDRAYQLAHLQEKPTDLQLQIAKQICSLTFEKEKAAKEANLLVSGNVYRKLPKSLDILEISLPKSITTLSDPIVREQLAHNYQRIIQRAQFDLATVLKTAAQAKKADTEKIFDQKMAELGKNQRQYPEQERLTRRMLTIIEQRQKNISQCTEWIYDLNRDFYSKAPRTVMAISH